jgi:hypothetical protein
MDICTHYGSKALVKHWYEYINKAELASGEGTRTRWVDGRVSVRQTTVKHLTQLAHYRSDLLPSQNSAKSKRLRKKNLRPIFHPRAESRSNRVTCVGAISLYLRQPTFASKVWLDEVTQHSPICRSRCRHWIRGATSLNIITQLVSHLKATSGDNLCAHLGHSAHYYSSTAADGPFLPQVLQKRI